MKAHRAKSFLLTALTLTLAAPLFAQSAKELEGTWVGGVLNPGGQGKSGTATMVAISELTIKDGKVVACKDKGGVSLGNCESLSLDPAKKTMDATGNTKNHTGVFQGIYRLKDGKLEWCAANPGQKRPDDYYTVRQVQFHMVFDKKK